MLGKIIVIFSVLFAVFLTMYFMLDTDSTFKKVSLGGFIVSLLVILIAGIMYIRSKTQSKNDESADSTS